MSFRASSTFKLCTALIRFWRAVVTSPTAKKIAPHHTILQPSCLFFGGAMMILNRVVTSNHAKRYLTHLSSPRIAEAMSSVNISA